MKLIHQMDIVSVANNIFGIGTIAAQLFLAAAILYLIFWRKSYPTFFNWMGKRGIVIAFLAVIASSLGSLFYSNVAGFAPCDLCWLQRAFIFSLLAVLGFGIVWRDRGVAKYGLVLGIIGWFIALYQNMLAYLPAGFSSCGVGPGAVSCLKQYVLEFGYITIPLMSLTSFSLIVLFLAVSSRRKTS